MLRRYDDSAVHDAFERKAHGVHHAGLDFAHRTLEGHITDLPIVALANFVEIDHERVGQHLDHASPTPAQRTGAKQRRFIGKRPSKAEVLAGEVGIRIGRVVHQLCTTNGIDPIREAQHGQGKEIAGKARIDTTREEGAPSLLAGRLERLAEFRVGEGRIDQ